MDSQLGTTTVKKEENQPKKPNLSEQLLAFAAAEEKLAKQKLVEPQALLAEPTYEVIPRERISFAVEEETWFSDKLAQRVRSVFDSAIQVKVEEEGKSATFCNVSDPWFEVSVCLCYNYNCSHFSTVVSWT